MLFDPPDRPESVEQQQRVEAKVARKPVGTVAIVLACAMALWVLIYVVVLLVGR